MGGLLNHCFTNIIHVINEGSDQGLSTIYHRWVGQSPKLKRELVDEHFTGRYHRLRGYLALPPVWLDRFTHFMGYTQNGAPLKWWNYLMGIARTLD